MPVVPTTTTRFATASDLASYLQRDFSAAETATAEMLLDLASAAIRDYTGQYISAVDDDIVTLDPPCGSSLFLPELPVTAVTSVVVAGTTLTLGSPSNISGYYWYGDTGIIRFVGRYAGYGYLWGWAPQSVVVTYSHGYDATPDGVRLVTIEAAAAMMGGGPDAGLKSETIGNYSYTSAGAGQAVADLAAGRLDRFRPLVLA